MATYKFQTDGSHLPAAKYREASTGYGWTLFRNDKPGFSWKRSFTPIDPSTNNIAEWLAVIDALKYTISNLRDATSIVIETDSELVVRQISGQYKIKNDVLKAIKIDYDFLIKHRFQNIPVSVNHIRREENEMADALSKLGSLLND